MENALEDEITSINSIYGDETLIVISTKPAKCTLRLPSHPSIVLRLEFPQDYPDAPPFILGTETVGDDAQRGAGRGIVQSALLVLAKVYRPGEACIYDLVEDIGEVLNQNHELEGPTHSEEDGIAIGQNGLVPQMQEESGPEPPWKLSTVVTEKKSVFVARAAEVSSPAQAKEYLQHLVATDKKVAKATHNITAWRIRGLGDSKFQDCDDDGESAAGGRLLHLMQLMDVWNVMVVVSRWYGGVHLGPDRFRLINSTARDALIVGGFTQDADGVSKKRGKR